jgi:hypothetical protein
MGRTHQAKAMQELSDGVAFWRRTTWPSDLHNSDYEEWAAENPNGNFTLDWWQQHQLPMERVCCRRGQRLCVQFVDVPEQARVRW